MGIPHLLPHSPPNAPWVALTLQPLEMRTSARVQTPNAPTLVLTKQLLVDKKGVCAQQSVCTSLQSLLRQIITNAGT